jgi:hypothetical protein
MMRVNPEFQPLMRQLGLDADTVFDHPDIVCWRKLPDRENCLLDADVPEAARVRLHIKRYLHRPLGERPTPADHDAAGTAILEQAGIATGKLIGWGRTADRGSFVIYQDLAGYMPADKLVAAGGPFQPLLGPTAELAAKLHECGLHHRDLYLCHFMARVTGDLVNLALIDTARVRKLPWLFPDRWIVKDLAQFWYSTLALAISDSQRADWLAHYAKVRKIEGQLGSLRRRIERKARSIARHDAQIHWNRPERDMSIPSRPDGGK